MSMPKRQISIKALVAVTCWGCSFVATRVALTALTPTGLVSLRFVVSSCTLVLLARAMGYPLFAGRTSYRRIVLLGCILAVHLLIQAVGLLKTSAIHTGWIIGFAPIPIAVGGWMFLGHRLARRSWLGIGLGGAGILTILLAEGMSFSAAKTGDLIQLVSCVTWAAYTLLAIKPIAEHGSLQVTVGSVITATVVLLPTMLLGVTTGSPITWQVIVAVLFLGVICSGIVYWLWMAAIRDVGSTSTGVYLYLEPFVTWGAAAMLLGESLSAIGLSGGLVVLVGVWIATVSGEKAKP